MGKKLTDGGVATQTSFATGDLLGPFVRDPGGTPASYKITVDNALKLAFTVNLLYVGDTLANGATRAIRLGPACRITSVELFADASGSVTVDVKRASYANLPSFTSMIGAGVKPALSSAQKSQDTNLSDWTDTTFDAGDWLQIFFSGITTITELSIALAFERTF
jgi:hypothetical protein